MTESVAAGAAAGAAGHRGGAALCRRIILRAGGCATMRIAKQDDRDPRQVHHALFFHVDGRGETRIDGDPRLPHFENRVRPPLREAHVHSRHEARAPPDRSSPVDPALDERR